VRDLFGRVCARVLQLDSARTKLQLDTETKRIYLMGKLNIEIKRNRKDTEISLGTWQDPSVHLPYWGPDDLEESIVEALQWAYAQGRIDESLQHQPQTAKQYWVITYSPVRHSHGPFANRQDADSFREEYQAHAADKRYPDIEEGE
jgi:hypothetical protein